MTAGAPSPASSSSNGHGPDQPANDAVAAHELLNSSAIVGSAIATLRAQWERLSAAHRTDLLEKMATHAARVDKALKDLTLGRPPR